MSIDGRENRMKTNIAHGVLPTLQQMLWMYGAMVKARQFEETVKRYYMEGKKPLFNMAKGPIPGEMHLSSGQEPCAVGICAHLRAHDTVTATHRPHHIAIAKGVNLNAMAAEIMGKKSGLSSGRGGHMHLFDKAVNFCCSGIIAQGMGPAAGAALATKLKGSDSVAVSYIGEGAANQGAFHEVLNLASLWNLPVIFVIEDNSWGISVPKQSSTSVERNAIRAAAYGIPGIFVEGNDTDRIFSVAEEAITRARNGGGPTLIEIETVRLEGHFMGDAEAYRMSELSLLGERDPIPHYKEKIIKAGVSAHDIEETTQKVFSEVEAAFDYALNADYPAPDEAYRKVFI